MNNTDNANPQGCSLFIDALPDDKSLTILHNDLLSSKLVAKIAFYTKCWNNSEDNSKYLIVTKKTDKLQPIVYDIPATVSPRTELASSVFSGSHRLVERTRTKPVELFELTSP